jgi:hypothetical protein
MVKLIEEIPSSVREEVLKVLTLLRLSTVTIQKVDTL